MSNGGKWWLRSRVMVTSGKMWQEGPPECSAGKLEWWERGADQEGVPFQLCRATRPTAKGLQEEGISRRRRS